MIYLGLLLLVMFSPLASHPFDYDLHMEVMPGAKNHEEVFICLHGMGSDYTIGRVFKINSGVEHPIVSFNFPDHGDGYLNLRRSSFGTFEELKPALFVWKNCLNDGKDHAIHLYGFSAGGGAVINLLAVLNGVRYDAELRQLGIDEEQKKRMLASVQKGSVVLEVPLKSFDELADLGASSMKFLAQRAKANQLCTIDNINQLQGLSLNCFVYFSQPDEALGNRDDWVYIDRLQKVNINGHTVALVRKSGGHTACHDELWQAYRSFLANRRRQ